MKRKAIALTLILALSATILAGTMLVNLGTANPYLYHEIPLPAELPQPNITILVPENNTIQAPNSYLTVRFNATLNAPANTYGYGIFLIYYQVSWLKDGVSIFCSNDEHNPKPVITSSYLGEFQVNLTGVPPGKNYIKIYVDAGGGYIEKNTINSYTFGASCSSTLEFNVPDTIPPKVTILSLENQTFSNSTVAFNFTVNELVSQLSYCLDGQDNVTVAGNTTLTGLSNGQHYLVVYSTDTAGNVGASETIYFIVNVPFPTALVIAASAVSIAIIGVGLLFYFRKRKR
jgi:hypothetical protein